MKIAAGWLFSFLALAVLAAASHASAQAGDEEGRAAAAAQAWVLLMDSGRFAETWDGASAGFRGAVGRDAWAKQAAAVRGPLGKVNARKAVEVTTQKNPPGAPPGDYVIVAFETDFADSAPRRRETVSTIREPDGNWRVIGYFIR